MYSQPLSLFACDQVNHVDGDAEPEVFQDVPYVLLHMTVCYFDTSALLCVQVTISGGQGSVLFPCAQGEELVTWLEKDTLDNLLARVAAAHAGYTLGLLIEGLHSYLKCAHALHSQECCPAACSLL